MPQYSWATCPAAVRQQIEQLLAIVQGALQDNLTGVYLHGSLAMGCFNPARSDLDLLVVTRQQISLETRRALVEALLRLSRNPSPIEISFLGVRQMIPWSYPTLFDLHYSEDWRGLYLSQLANSDWRNWNNKLQQDYDLAAHITITRARGICLLGQPIDTIFPPVPAQHYIDSIWHDFLIARIDIMNNPPYFVLNACRVAAYLLEKRICSKEEGGVWALNVVPEAHTNLILQALEMYRGGEEKPFDAAALEQFGAYMEEWLEPFAPAAPDSFMDSF
jgi:predicted nucleotidyltransferase